MEKLKVSTLEDLKKMAEGEIVPLPSFCKDIPFNVRVKQASLLNLLSKGVIPNSLLSAAEELFYGKQSSKGVDMKDLSKTMLIVAENVLLEPNIDDLKNAGLELTDNQIVALFNYSQKGLNALAPSDTESESANNSSNEQPIQNETQSDS